MNITKKNIQNYILEYIYIVLGAFIISVGINLFLLPHKMTTGGASGIATMLYYLFNIPLGVTTICINIPLLILSYIKLGKKYTIKTIVSTVVLSIFFDIFKLNNILDFLNLDLLMSCILGGITVGIGISFTFKAGASSGGSDLLANIIYKLKKVNSVSQVLLVIEFVIISGIIITFKDINVGLYSIISMIISTKVIDLLFEGIYYTKVVTIITKKKDEILKRIFDEIGRGATVTNVIGAYTNEEKYEIICIVDRSQVSKIKRIVIEEDMNSIMYITSSSETLGYGFKQIEWNEKNKK